MNYIIRPITKVDREWSTPFIEEHWGSRFIVTRGRRHDAGLLPGFIAEAEGKSLGLITFRLSGQECEVMSLNSTTENRGVGSGLIAAVLKKARKEGCHRVWLITTNDNTHALHFYQRRGFTLKALYPGALKQSRLLKPEIPLSGIDNIPLRDEIELEYFFPD